MNYKKIQLVIFLGMVIFSLSFQAVSASEIEKKNVIDLTNYSRIKNGLDVLMENAKLNEAAMQKAQDMFQNNYFAHTSPQDITPWVWFEKVKYEYKYAGENLAINFKNAEDEHEAWMESETHKKNILNPKYQEIGVAVQRGIIDGKAALVAVQLFGAQEDFQVVLGKETQGDSLGLLNRELESGPFGKPVFAQEPAQKAIDSEKNSSPQYTVGKLTDISKNRMVDFFQASGVITLMVIMIINPILVAGLFWRRKKKAENDPSIVYPVKIILAK